MARFTNTRNDNGFIRGYPVEGWITAPFGVVSSVHPQGHSGMDIGASQGTPIRAPSAATVKDVFIFGLNPGGPWDAFKATFGNAVILDDGEHVQLFAHMVDAPVVREGQHVNAGDVIGYVGNTGYSFGAHLHWGVAPSSNPYLERARGLLNPLSLVSTALAPPPATEAWKAKYGWFYWQEKWDPAADSKLPISFAFLKAADGLDWMRRYDPQGIGSLDDVRTRVAQGRDHGLGVICWVNAKGGDNAHQEGKRAGEIARASGHHIIMVDLEAEPGLYWTPKPGAVRAWCEGFAEGADGRGEIWLVPDSRKSKLKGIQYEDWLKEPLVTRHWPQDYWSAFQLHIPLPQVLHTSTDPLLELGIEPWRIFPVYMTTDLAGRVYEPGANFVTAINWTAQQGFGGLAIWRRGLTNQQQFEAIGRHPMPAFGKPPATPQPEPEPEPEPGPDDPVLTYLASAREANRIIAGQVESQRIAIDAAIAARK